jgi:ribose transport system permease protein
MAQLLQARAARPVAVVVLLVAAVLVAGEFLPYFATTSNITNILIQASVVAVAAFGMTVVILTGGIDLSVGGVMSLVGVLEAVLMTGSTPWPVAVAIGLATGAFIGLVNGLVVARLRLPPFIATFGSLGIAAGLALYIADALPISVLPTSFVTIGNGTLGAVPYLVLFSAGLLLVLEVVFRTTRWGVRLRATGDALPVARLSGVPIARTLTGAYTTAGLMSGLAGTILAANLSTAGPLQGQPYTLWAIAACVIGGVDLFGGRGHLWAAAAGTVFLAAVRNALNLQGVQPFMQDLVTGCLIILAVFVTTRGPEIRQRWLEHRALRQTRTA